MQDREKIGRNNLYRETETTDIDPHFYLIVETLSKWPSNIKGLLQSAIQSTRWPPSPTPSLYLSGWLAGSLCPICWTKQEGENSMATSCRKKKRPD